MTNMKTKKVVIKVISHLVIKKFWTSVFSLYINIYLNIYIYIESNLGHFFSKMTND